MKWAVDDPARFQHEQVEIERLQAEVDWLSFAWRMSKDIVLEVDIDMVVHGRTYAGRLTYPTAFPDAPPYIRPRDHASRWSIHQYGDGGPLCLRWRPDNWQPHVTAAEMIRDAYELLNTEQAPENPGAVPSAHRVTEGQTVRSKISRLILTPQMQAAVLTLPKDSTGHLKSRCIYHALLDVSLFTKVMFITEVTSTGSEVIKVDDLPPGLEKLIPLACYEKEGLIVRNESLRTAQISTPDELLQVLKRAGISQDEVLVLSGDGKKYDEREVIIVGDDVLSLRMFSIYGDVADPKIDAYHILFPPAETARLPQEHTRLHQLKFGIVGLGSVGSKLAISLARSGARNFLLIDDDYLGPGNVCRNELSWMFVGVQKGHAISEMMSLIAPGITTTVKSHRFAGQESSVEAANVLNELTKCDILIDTTANPEVFLRLAGIARRNQKSLCWGELFAGGYGGLIARARADLDPNPLYVRDGIHTFLNEQPSAPFKNAVNYNGTDQEPLTAYDSDVGYIATALTRLVLDTALVRNPSDFPYPAYLVGMRKEWIFEQPFDTRPIEIPGDGWETESKADPVLKEIVIGQLLKLAAEGLKDAEPDTAT